MVIQTFENENVEGYFHFKISGLFSILYLLVMTRIIKV